MNNKLQRKKTFCNDVIFINGLWGSGKSILAPIIGAMNGVEKQKIEYIYEYLCILRYLDKIDEDACNTLLKTYADISQYNNLIGREVNLRWNDDSGLKNNPNSFRYIARILGKEGDSIVNDIKEKNLALLIMSHMITLKPDPLIESYGDRLKIVELVRHPLYMVDHWYAFLSRFDSERIFTLSFDHKGEKVPWFASNWKDEFINMSVMDRSLCSLIFVYEELFKSLDDLNDKNIKILTIPFESILFDTQNTLLNLENFLGRGFKKSIKGVLKKQKIPRKKIYQGRMHAKYLKNLNLSNIASDKEDYDNRLASILKNGSKSKVKKLDKLIKEYNQKWPSILSSYR
jgi:hypothetical protein